MKKHRQLKTWCLAIALAGTASTVHSSETLERKCTHNRLELSATYEYLSPRDIYGEWKNYSGGWWHRASDTFTWFVNGGGVCRYDGKSAWGGGGAYLDCTDCFYTYSSLLAATNPDILSRFRIDQEFNLKLGNSKEWVISLGVTYLNYSVSRNDLLFSTGMTLYRSDWVFSYKFFLNFSHPSSAASVTNLFSAGYGQEGTQWTYFNVSCGESAYLAMNVEIPQEIRQKACEVSLKHRRWVGSNYGILAEINYLNVISEYKKYGYSGGLFYEF